MERSWWQTAWVKMRRAEEDERQRGWLTRRRGGAGYKRDILAEGERVYR
jgi:hypothetical protein